MTDPPDWAVEMADSQGPVPRPKLGQVLRIRETRTPEQIRAVCFNAVRKAALSCGWTDEDGQLIPPGWTLDDFGDPEPPWWWENREAEPDKPVRAPQRVKPKRKPRKNKGGRRR
jgi:hypothetical protein